jgi:hypothetical protein
MISKALYSIWPSAKTAAANAAQKVTRAASSTVETGAKYLGAKETLKATGRVFYKGFKSVLSGIKNLIFHPIQSIKTAFHFCKDACISLIAKIKGMFGKGAEAAAEGAVAKEAAGAASTGAANQAAAEAVETVAKSQSVRAAVAPVTSTAPLKASSRQSVSAAASVGPAIKSNITTPSAASAAAKARQRKWLPKSLSQPDSSLTQAVGKNKGPKANVSRKKLKRGASHQANATQRKWPGTQGSLNQQHRGGS